MRTQEIICTVCPIGCLLQVTGRDQEILSVTGNNCPRGERYAQSEFICPIRTLTTTVRIKNADEPLLPVRSAQPIPKSMQCECMNIIRKAVFTAPVSEHQVLISNIAGTGVDIIACSDREQCNRS